MRTEKTILKKKVFPFIVMALAMAMTMFLLAHSSVKATSDTTKVVLEKEGQDVKVSISPEKGASIASFQIGLKIEASKAADIKDVTFNWANIGNAKLKKESYDKEKGILNLYVVTDTEQNTGNDISVGIVKIETNKNTQVSVSPIANKTTASSISHHEAEIEAKATDKVTFTTTASGGNTGDNNQGGSSKPEDNKPNDSNKPGDSSNQGGSQGSNNNGSGKPGNSSNNGSQGSGSNSENDTNKKDEEDEDKNEETNKESNTENSDETENSSNQLENIATGTLPQAGENDNFMYLWIFMALIILVGVLLAFGYKSMNRKNSFKL